MTTQPAELFRSLQSLLADDERLSQTAETPHEAMIQIRSALDTIESLVKNKRCDSFGAIANAMEDMAAVCLAMAATLRTRAINQAVQAGTGIVYEASRRKRDASPLD